MSPAAIQLRILLPYGLFLDQSDVSGLVAETDRGSFGILPHRLDCAAALVPGILSYKTGEGTERFVAIDEGILVKTGRTVTVSVRNAIAGPELGDLRQAVDNLFGGMNEAERNLRSVLNRLEGHFLHHLMEFGHDRHA